MSGDVKHKRGDVHPVTGLVYWDTFHGRERWRTPTIIARWRENHMRYVRAFQAKYPERRRANDVAMRAKRKVENAARMKEWKIKNKKRWAFLKLKHHKKRLKQDPSYRLRFRIRSLLRAALVAKGYKKACYTEVVLGCTFQQLREHIQKQFTDGMSWARIGEIDIDHKVPVSLAVTEADVLMLNHYTNLRPMWRKDNLSKSSKLIAA